jgi:hypothetical protein
MRPGGKARAHRRRQAGVFLGAGQALFLYALSWCANIAGKRPGAWQSETNSNKHRARYILQYGLMNGAPEILM